MKRITTTPLPPIILERDVFNLGGWFMALAVANSSATITLGTILIYLLLF